VELTRFPQGTLRSDRLSVLEQWGLSEEDAAANEERRGRQVVETGEAVAGAQRFASGSGRRGSFTN
jgi:enoyl-CoA hydratase